MRGANELKKIAVIAVVFAVYLIGCTSTETQKPVLSDSYNIGDEIMLADTAFNVYKIDDSKDELYLLAQNSIAKTKYSDDDHEGAYANSYENSIIESYVDEFVENLEQQNIDIISSGLIDEEDLYNLGFERSGGLSGLPYRYTQKYDFIRNGESFWVGGYCKYHSMTWVYDYGSLDADSCDKEYDLRPALVISPTQNNIKESK